MGDDSIDEMDVEMSRAVVAERKRPNIFITGSVGTGKSSLATRLVARLGSGFEHLDVARFAHDNGCIGGYDETRQCDILQESLLLQLVQERLDSREGGIVADYDAGDLLPSRCFDLVVVLRVHTAVLFERLSARGYPLAKVQENVQREMCNTSADEATRAFPSGIVCEMPSDSAEHMEDNLEKILAKIYELKLGNGVMER